MDKLKQINNKSKVSLGVFQGRLTPRGFNSIQFYPFDNWENEFESAKRLGLSEIEFIFDYDRFQENALWNEKGIERIKFLTKKTGVVINHICADFFMSRPFFRTTEKIRKDNVLILKRLIEVAREIGASNIEIPILDNSSIRTSDEENTLIKSIYEAIPTAEAHAVTIGLETDLPPGKFLELLKKFNSTIIKANYDSGNSAGLGYDHKEEITTLKDYIGNIHIKDRKLHGITVPLGEGNADFDKFFSTISDINYCGSLILQPARGEDGKENETLLKYIDFVKTYLKKYSISIQNG